MKKLNYNNIVLIGFMGTGKSTIANYISNVFKMEIIDTDNVIEKEEGMTVKNIFLHKGEEYFRNKETMVLEGLKNKKNIVVSCGGGIILKDENIKYLKKCGMVVLLDSTAKTIYARIKHSDTRPILNNNMSIETIETMLKNRRNNYMKAADLVIKNENKPVEEIAKEIMLQR